MLCRDQQSRSIVCAKVYLAEASRRRESAFHAQLLWWARDQRLRAGGEPRLSGAGQGELFPAEAQPRSLIVARQNEWVWVWVDEAQDLFERVQWNGQVDWVVRMD